MNSVGSAAQPFCIPHTMPSWKGSNVHSVGYGWVGGPPGLTRAGSKVFGQNETGSVKTTWPAEFRTVSVVNPFRPLKPSRMLAGSGLRTIPPDGGWMIWVIVTGLVYDARWTSNCNGERRAETQMPGSRNTRPPKSYSVTLRWAASSFSTGPGAVAAPAAGPPGMAIAATARPAAARAPRCGTHFVNRITPSFSPPAPEAGRSTRRRRKGARRCPRGYFVNNTVGARDLPPAASRPGGRSCSQGPRVDDRLDASPAAADVPGPGQGKAPAAPNTWREAGWRLPPGRSWHGRPANDDPGACSGSLASAVYHRRPAGLVSCGLGFGCFRVGGQEAKAVAVAVAIAVARPRRDVHQGLRGAGQRHSARPEPAGCAGILGWGVYRAGGDRIARRPGCGLAGQTDRHGRPAVAGAGWLRQPAGCAG